MEVHAGVQLNNLVLLSGHATAIFDSSYYIPTQAQKKGVEEQYGQTASHFVMSLYPRIDLRIAVIKQLGFILSLQPLMIYFNSTNKTLVKNSTGFTGFLGMYYVL